MRKPTNPVERPLPAGISLRGRTFQVEKLDPQLAEDAHIVGRTGTYKGKIWVDENLDPWSAWQVLFHEVFHLEMLDAGDDNTIPEPQGEKLCDMVGTMMAELIATGQIIVTGTPPVGEPNATPGCPTRKGR